MCKAMEDMRNEADRLAREDERRSMALELIMRGKMPHEEISQISMLPMAEIKTLAERQFA